jgi:ABC-type transporter Mla maintaining outer membrane lipid asymmetry ATPase subunit MlaF
MLIMDLSPRPLLDTSVDQQLYLKRPVHDKIKRLIERHNNVLVYGDRGIGKTTLLRAVAYDLRGDGIDATFIESRLAKTALELVDLVRTRLTPSVTVNFNLSKLFKGPSPFLASEVSGDGKQR